MILHLEVCIERMLRRRFLPLFLLLLLVGATAAQAADKFVAVIITGNLPRYQRSQEAFLRVLRAGGLDESKVEVYVQTPNPDPISLANSVRKAVGINADLLFTYGAQATLVARHEGRGLPLLFADVYDPVGLGLAKTLAVPGVGISGVSDKTPTATLLRTFTDVFKGASIGALYAPGDAGAALQVEDLERAAAAHGLKVVRQGATSLDGVESACTSLCSQVDALFVAESTILELRRQQILASAAHRGIPVISQIPGLSDQGALMTIEADPEEQGELAGTYALQMLSADGRDLVLPVRTPHKVSLVINMKTARNLHLTIPFQALTQATRVVK